MPTRHFLEAIPQNYEKKGSSAIVDTAVQDCIDYPASTDEILSALKKDLTNIGGRHNEAVENLEVARRYSQATVALVSFAALAHAFPRLNEWYQEHGTLIDTSDTNPDPIAIGLRRLSGSLEYVLEGLHANPEDPLSKHLAVSKTELNQAYREWKATPIGQKSWPILSEGEEIGRGTALLKNIPLTSNSLAAFSVYAAVHRGIQRPEQAEDLIEMTRAEAIPRIVWSATVHRHVTRTKENLKLLEEGKEMKVFVPHQATKLLAYESIAQLGLEATIREFTDRPMARNPQFCPHASLENGPLNSAWHCAGNVNARYSQPKDQAEAAAFFENMGLGLEPGGLFSPVFAVTALMATVHRDTLQPQWLKITSGHYPDIQGGQVIFEEERQRLLNEQMALGDVR